MRKQFNFALTSVAVAAMLATPFADAGRLGGGRSSGMSRSYSAPRSAPSQSYSRPAPAPVAPAHQSAPQAPRSGPGWGGVAAGAAAGAAAGYLMGKASEPSAPAYGAAPQAAVGNAGGASAGWGVAPAPVSAPAQSSFPWGTLLLLGGLTALGFMWYKRRVAAQTSPAPMAYGGGRGLDNGYDQGQGSGRVYKIGGDAQPAALSAPSRLADGTETSAFLRQAKASFMHLQTMNSPDSVEELRKYFTPELFESIKADVVANKETAEFPQLDAELVETAEENGQYIASVRFSGNVSESLNAPVQPFEEMWHFIKPSKGDNLKWLVAGIQQI